MFRLTREVRFAINADHRAHPQARGSNNYAANPALVGFGHYFEIAVTVSGDLDADAGYLLNIKYLDAIVRDRAISAVASVALDRDAADRTCPNRLVAHLFDKLRWGHDFAPLECVRLSLSPFLHVSAHREELPMTRLSQKFEFSASHRLHSPALSDEENCKTYGKCNNPHGHGHNYEVQVTLIGQPDERGVLVDVPAFERTVAETVIERFDHKNLNVELPEFRELIPSVENIAMVIYRLLKPRFDAQRAKLAAVTVWETPKTWCEYSE